MHNQQFVSKTILSLAVFPQSYQFTTAHRLQDVAVAAELAMLPTF